MKKFYFLAAAASVMLLGSCSDDINVPQSMEEVQQAERVPVTFGTYLGNTAQTRAGATGAIDNTTTLQTIGETSGTPDGFGVIAVYNNATAYNELADRTPNFMYNEQITYQSSKWDYKEATNVKYWPNEFANGAVDAQSPAAEGTVAGGKVSFFAYAPYVAVTPSTGAVTGTNTYGITALSKNDSQDDPTVSYTIDLDNFVDLLWGTARTDNGSSAVSTTAQTGATVTKKPNTGHTSTEDYSVEERGTTKVNIDLIKMKTEGKVSFLFKHALAKIGDTGTSTGLQIVTDIDDTHSSTAATNTKVTVKEIKIETKDTPTTGYEMYKSGTLNLATGYWTRSTSGNQVSLKRQLNVSGTPDAGYDGYKLNITIAEPSTTTYGDLYDTSTETWKTSANMPTGVTGSPTNVYDDDATPKALVFIPGTKPELVFTITYAVRTLDKKLTKGYSEVLQTIKKTVQFTNAVELNKVYNIIIHLGLTSVKFEATVDNWDPATSGVGASDNIVHMPLNVSGS